MVKRNSIEDTFNGEQKLRILSVQHFFRLCCMADFLGGSSKVWRWPVRQKTQRESWKRHSITVSAPPGGGVFLPSLKSLTHRRQKFSDTLGQALELT
jgi:hypothetical protein